MSAHENSRPPLPPFTSESAAQKVRVAEDAWNTRDPERVSLAQESPMPPDERTLRQYPSDIAFTQSVKRVQSAKGSRGVYSRMETRAGWNTRVTPVLARFLAGLDMFYLGTANAEGQPYVQYRGGSRGVLKVLDDRTLGFADFSGNRQYITVGNLFENPRAFLFLIDYANRQRVKVWGASVVEDDRALLNRLQDPGYPGKAERAIVFAVEAWDLNCQQHIHSRFPESQVTPVIEDLRARIADLEARLAHEIRNNRGA